MGKIYGFRNDHDSSMNCVGTCGQIRAYIEGSWDTTVEEMLSLDVVEMSEISDASEMFSGDEDCKSEMFTDLRN